MSIDNLAAWLLGRALTAQDGSSENEILLAEKALNCAIPAVLRNFYIKLGNQAGLMSSFQRFLKPNDWMVNQGKVVFLEENQSVCYWAADIDNKVYQASDWNASEWHEESVNLSEFLRIMLYYQMAQGGYEYCGMIPGREFPCRQKADDLINEMGGQEVVSMAGLKIFVVSDQVLVWYLHEREKLDPGLFLSVLRENEFHDLCEKWLFDDLS